MTTDPREIPQTREEKLAATSTMYDTSKIIAERDAREAATKPAILIGFANAGLKIHKTARCGMTRNNRVHNTPHLLNEREEEFACKRCGGPTEEATNETIEKAWQDAYRQGRRSPYGGMDEAYTVSQMFKMQADLAERKGG